MKDAHRSIFREEALRRYIEGKEKAVLPQLVSPHSFAYLWLMLSLLGVSSLMAWLTKVPIYASGTAVVVRLDHKLNHRTNGVNDDIVIAAFFEAKHLSSLQKTQKLLLSFDAMSVGETSNKNRFYRSIIAVEPKIISPDRIHKQFGLNAQLTTQPAVVAIAKLEPTPKNLPASAYVGSVGDAKAEVGSQRLVSLLPFMNKKGVGGNL